MKKGYKVRFKASSPKKGYKYKTVRGYSNAVYNKYKDKIEARLKEFGDRGESENKRLFSNLVKQMMKDNPEMTMRQAASAVLNSDTFTNAAERTEMRIKKDFGEFRQQLGYEKGHRFRDKNGRYRTFRDMLGDYDPENKGYHFTDYRIDETGKLSAYEYSVKYNYSPKGNQPRWDIKLVSIKRT